MTNKLEAYLNVSVQARQSELHNLAQDPCTEQKIGMSEVTREARRFRLQICRKIVMSLIVRS